MDLSPARTAVLGAGLVLIASAAQAQPQKPQPPKAQPAQAQQSLNQTMCLNRERKFTAEQQIRACTAVAQSEKIPRNAALAYYIRGNVHAYTGEVDRAIEDYSQAIRRNPKHAEAYNNRGNAYGRKGDTERALADHNEAVKLAPKSPPALKNRGTDLQAKGRYDDALKDYDQAIKLAPKFAEALNARCSVRAILGRQLLAAVKDCDAALGLNPDDATRASIFDNRALAYTKLGELYTAMTDYNAALEINPRSASALYGRGYVKLKKGDFSGEADIATAKALQPAIAEDYAKFGVK